MDILSAMNDPDIFEPGMTEEEGSGEKYLQCLESSMLTLILCHLRTGKKHQEKACEFIDCGIKNDGKPRPRIMDWEQDAPIIIPAVNKVNNAEVRATDYMHWWTFFGLYMEIGESTFSTVVSIRDKKKKVRS